MGKNNKSKNVNKNKDFHVRIDKGWQDILIIFKSSEKTSFKDLIEDALSNTYIIENGKWRRIKR